MSSVNTNPSGHPPFAPTYSHISTATLLASSKLISIAGQIGHDAATNHTPPDFASQVSIALANLDKCLQAAGATKADIVQVRHYTVQMSKMTPEEKKVRADLYTKFMGDARPPATNIGVESLATPELLYEIEVMAVVNT